MIDNFFFTKFGRYPEVYAYAPGRLEFIGNHTDYNGGSVIGMTVDRGINVALANRDDGNVHLVSESMEGDIIVELNDIKPLTGSNNWANYPLGVLKVMSEEGYSINRGFSLAVTSNLPVGSGLSSSAAIELSTAFGLSALNDFEVDRKKMVLMCRRAENEFVGMPCGILDQGVSAFGGRNHLVHIDCFTESFKKVSMPKGCCFWILDTNKKHALIDSKYSERHQECRRAFDILKINDPSADCLACLSPLAVRDRQAELGVDCFKRALHVTEENKRVEQAVDALGKEDMNTVGRLLKQSHESSRTLFENSCPELDFLVEMLLPLPGVYGARLSGGGFGGAVMALTNKNVKFSDDLTQIEERYFRKFKIKPTIYNVGLGQEARATTAV